MTISATVTSLADDRLGLESRWESVRVALAPAPPDALEPLVEVRPERLQLGPGCHYLFLVA
jgi:hypothetical protein